MAEQMIRCKVVALDGRGGRVAVERALPLSAFADPGFALDLALQKDFAYSKHREADLADGGFAHGLFLEGSGGPCR